MRYNETSVNLLQFSLHTLLSQYETKCSPGAVIVPLHLRGKARTCQELREFHRLILELRNHFKIHSMMSAAWSDKIVKAHNTTKQPNYHNPVDPELQLGSMVDAHTHTVLRLRETSLKKVAPNTSGLLLKRVNDLICLSRPFGSPHKTQELCCES